MRNLYARQRRGEGEDHDHLSRGGECKSRCTDSPNEHL